MALTLDRSKEYGEVHPPENGVHYEQDGFLFGPHGELLEAFLDDAAKKRLALIDAITSANAAAEQARADALKAAGYDPANPVDAAAPQVAPIPTPALPDATSTGGVDLRGWLLGNAQYQFFAVVAAVKELYGFSPTTKAQAIEFLTSADPQIGGPKLVSAGDVKA